MDNPWDNEYTKQANHLHKILERVQRQQREEMNNQEALEHQPHTPEKENGSNTTSPEARGSDLLVTTNANPQDQVLDYSKKGSSRSSTSRLQEVPTYQTSIFSGEFRNSAELQNFERLLELRSAKRKAAQEQDFNITKSYQSVLHQNNNDHQKQPASTHAALGMLAALAPIKLPRTESPPIERTDIVEESPPYSPPASGRTMIPSEIAANPLVAMNYLKCTNESQHRYDVFRRGLLGKMDASTKTVSQTSQYSPPSSSSSSENGSPSYQGNINHNKTETFSQDKSNNLSKDESYWEKRKKNNEAARRSRNVRKAKEQETALRAEFLEKENSRMKMQLSMMLSHVISCNCQPNATSHLKSTLYNNQR